MKGHERANTTAYNLPKCVVGRGIGSMNFLISKRVILVHEALMAGQELAGSSVLQGETIAKRRERSVCKNAWSAQKCHAHRCTTRGLTRAMCGLHTVACRDVGKPIVVDVGTVHRIEASHLLGFGNGAGMTSVRVQQAARVEMFQPKCAILSLFEVGGFQRLAGGRHNHPVRVAVLERNCNNGLLVRC